MQGGSLTPEPRPATGLGRVVDGRKGSHWHGELAGPAAAVELVLVAKHAVQQSDRIADARLAREWKLDFMYKASYVNKWW